MKIKPETLIAEGHPAPLLSFVSQAVAFAAGLALLYALLIAAATVIPFKGRPLLDRWVEYRNESGGKSASLARFREAEAARGIDVLFLGSSHAYRFFDVRVFREEGLSSFNMGSVAQTPLNAYYLLERYFDRLKPRVVVMECYPLMLQSEDGLESFRDLVVNMPLSLSLARMALATGSPQALHLLASEGIRRWISPLGRRRQQADSNQIYVPGGYIESHGVWRSHTFFEPEQVFLAERQLKYILKIGAYCKKRGARLVLVLQPMPPAHLAAVSNYESALKRLRAAADRAGAEFIDYSRLRVPIEDFAEVHTLSAQGAAKVSRRLAAALKRADPAMAIPI